MIVLDRVADVQGGVGWYMRAEKPRKDLPAHADDLREAVHRSEWISHIDRMLRRAREVDIRNTIPGNAYVVNTGGSALALAAATAKTIMYINSAAANQPSWVEWCVGFDGVTASAVPAVVETVYGTKASNSTPGTASTSFTPVQVRGWPTQASAQTAANACTSEPTVLVSHKPFLVTPNGGLLVMQLPLGRELTGVASGAAISGIQTGLRVTAPAIVNTRGYIEFEE